MMKFFRKQIRNIKGLNTVPGIIALALWSFSLITLWLDQSFPEFSSTQPFRLFYTDYETAKAVLSTVAAASITTLGLVYSIVLVVFTTAAGNIGPRLLQRFTSDTVNQFTAGLFGGTFLFSLTVLHQTDSGFVPAISIAVTFLLAGLAVLQLIYFVHKASVSVTIDEEVAEIADQLEKDIAKLVGDEDGLDDYDQDPPEKDSYKDHLLVEISGYITHIDVQRLVKLAAQHDVFISLCHGHGNFIIPGLKLAEFTIRLEGKNRDDLFEDIRDSITISQSRSPDSDVEFSTSLLIEIALRALSPGTNDTFTAVACVDRITSALVRPVRRGLRDHFRADEKNIPRVYLPGMTLKDLLNNAFHPLRRASAGNILMTKHLLDALGRLFVLGDEEACRLIKDHAETVVEGVKGTNALKSDIEFVHKHYQKLFKG